MNSLLHCSCLVAEIVYNKNAPGLSKPGSAPKTLGCHTLYTILYIYGKTTNQNLKSKAPLDSKGNLPCTRQCFQLQVCWHYAGHLFRSFSWFKSSSWCAKWNAHLKTKLTKLVGCIEHVSAFCCVTCKCELTFTHNQTSFLVAAIVSGQGAAD